MPISFEAIKQRKLVQWAVAYMAIAWSVLQVVDVVGNNFHWPAWIARVATILLAAGFIAVLIVAWYHGEKGNQKFGAAEILLLVITVLMGAAGAFYVSRPDARDRSDNADAPGIEPGSVAVLAFANRSSNTQDEYFSDGISEEILNALARIPNLHVRARSSSFAFKNKNLPAPEIARQLRVQYVLDGSVQRSGDRVRISAQLIDARKDASVWNDQFERELHDVFAVEDDISRAIAEVLRLRLVDQSSSARTENVEAHELYLRGRYLLAKGSEEFIEESSGYFERATALDPTYAAAYGALAESYMLSTGFRNINEMFDKARRAARHALQLDERQAEVHGVVGALMLWRDWDVTGSEREFKRALELNPNAANTYDYYAWVLQLHGQMDEALRMAKESVRIDPFSAWLSYALEFRYVQRRDWDRAIAQHRITAALDPNEFYWDLPVGIAYREKHRYDDAVRAYQRVSEHAGGRPLHGLAITYARMGRTADARRILAQLEQLAKTEWIPPEQIALVYANLGDLDTAMKQLERSYSTGDSWLLGWISVDPSYDPLRADPRFRDLERRVRAKLH